MTVAVAEEDVGGEMEIWVGLFVARVVGLQNNVATES